MNKPQPVENGRRGGQRPGFFERAGTFRQFRCLYLAVRGRPPRAQPLARTETDTGSDGHVAADEPRVESQGFQIRRAGDLLRVHAGHRYGERPSG